MEALKMIQDIYMLKEKLENYISIQEKKIILLNQVIKNQEQEIDELKKGIHVDKKRRGWHY